MGLRLQVLLVAVLAVACGPAGRRAERGGRRAVDGDQWSSRGAQQTGKASWYGGKFQGRKTASGERFDRHAFTAAHRRLAFGTRVRVTHVASGRQVVVRINDRGPFGGGRIIDLSEAAARQLGMIREGVATVSIEVIGSAR